MSALFRSIANGTEGNYKVKATTYRELTFAWSLAVAELRMDKS